MESPGGKYCRIASMIGPWSNRNAILLVEFSILTVLALIIRSIFSENVTTSFIGVLTFPSPAHSLTAISDILPD
jgi:hypothetical protein